MACLTRCCFIPMLIAVVFFIFIWDLSPFDASNRINRNVEYLGLLTPNEELDSSVRLFEGKMIWGPESLAIRNGKFYTGTTDGRIVEIDGNKLRTVARIGGNDCVMNSFPVTDKTCGRPLGMRFDTEGNLIVVDLTRGLYKVDIKTGMINILVSSSTKINGREVNFANDLAVSKAGDIYFSDTLDKNILLNPLWHSFFSNKPAGRILHYDPKTKKVKQLLGHIYFANGIELSPEEDFLLINQMLEKNIIKYHLKGSKKGQAEIFVDNLPGYNDNIRASGRGTYWIAILFPKVSGVNYLWDRLTCHFTKYIVYSTMQLAINLLDFSRTVFPNQISNVWHHSLKHCLENSIYSTDYGLVVEINSQGEIIRSLHSPKGVVSLISQATEHQGMLYLSSPFNSFLAKYSLKQ